MYPLQRVGPAAAAVLALTFTACAPVTINSYVQRDAPLTQYRTYEWAAADAFSTGDPRLDNNTFFQDRVKAEVEKALARRGYEPGSGGSADVVLHYHASVTHAVEPNGLDRKYGYCAEECEPYVYEAGTLVIDLVDRRTNRLAWRGWAEGSIDGVIDNQASMERRIGDTVGRIMAKLAVAAS